MHKISMMNLCHAESLIQPSSESPVEGIFPLELRWVLTLFPKNIPKNSLGWEKKTRSSLCTCAFITWTQNPLYQRLRGGSNPQRWITQDSKRNTLLTKLFCPMSTVGSYNKCLPTQWISSCKILPRTDWREQSLTICPRAFIAEVKIFNWNGDVSWCWGPCWPPGGCQIIEELPSIDRKTCHAIHPLKALALEMITDKYNSGEWTPVFKSRSSAEAVKKGRADVFLQHTDGRLTPRAFPSGKIRSEVRPHFLSE